MAIKSEALYVVVNAIELGDVNCRMQFFSRYKQDLVNPICNNLDKIKNNQLLLDMIKALELLC